MSYLIMEARKKRIAKLREQLPFLNQYQKDSPNEELKKHSRYIMNLFERADKEGKDLNIPDQKIDLLIASVEKLKEYTNTVKSKGVDMQKMKNLQTKAMDPKMASVKTISTRRSSPAALTPSPTQVVKAAPKLSPATPINKESSAPKPSPTPVVKEPPKPSPAAVLKETPVKPKEVPPKISTPASNPPSDSETSPANKSAETLRRQEKELRRLQMNIVKDGPLPSRRAVKRNARYLDMSEGSEPPADNGSTEENQGTKTRSVSPVNKEIETPEPKVIERRSLPLKVTKPVVEEPKAKSPEITTSTPKITRPQLSKPSTSFERVMPIKRKSETALKDERIVPPLKISMLAKKAAEKSIEIKRVTPFLQKRLSSPIEDKAEKKFKSSDDGAEKKLKLVPSDKTESAKEVPEVKEKTNDVKDVKADKPKEEEITFKFKKIVLKQKGKDGTIERKDFIVDGTKEIPVLISEPVKASTANSVLKMIKNNIADKPKEAPKVDGAMDMELEVPNEIPKEVPKEPKIIRKDIENMGYVAVRSGFIFQCIVENCFFNTAKRFAFIKHLDESHSELKWSGYCKLCSDMANSNDLSSEGEFFHMTEHVQKEKNNPEDLPDITELPKEKINESLNGSTGSVKSLRIIEFSDNSNDSIRSISSTTSSIPMEIDNSCKRITVKSFANISKFTPQDDAPKIIKLPYESLIKRPTNNISLLRNVQVPKKDLSVEAKTTANNLRALMQKQTEENLKKLQIANKNVSISQIRTNTSSPPTVKIVMNAPKPTTPEGPEPHKFIIRKPMVVRPPGQNVQERPVMSERKEIISRIISKGDENNVTKQTVSLRPWILTRPLKKYVGRTVKILSPAALCATFKCTGAKCEFFTDSAKSFELHLNIHAKSTPHEMASIMICPYCEFNSTNYSTQILIDHITSQHAFDNYQCKYCFYRSCANFNVIEHQKIYHRLHKFGIIQLNNERHRDYKVEIQRVKASCGKFIKPLVCATCKLNTNEVKKFYVLKHYLNHLKDHERNGEKVRVTCKKCKMLFESAEAIFQHVSECFNNLALQQCVYCLFGTNSVDKMHEHMCNKHPSKMCLVCIREDTDPMKEGAPQDDYQATSLKFLSKQVDSEHIVKVDVLMRPHVSGPIPNVSGGIQIQNVYSLSH